MLLACAVISPGTENAAFFPLDMKGSARKGYFRKERSCLSVFPEHWNDVAVLWRRPFGCTRLFYNLKSSAEPSFAEPGEDRNYFFWSQCLLVSGHTGGLEILSHTHTKSLSPCTPIFWIHIHFLDFILKPSWAWEHQLGLSFLRSRIKNRVKPKQMIFSGTCSFP